MGGVSIWHWIIVGIVVMLLFGRGKVSELMGDVAKGIKAFKKGMADEDAPPASGSPSTLPPAEPLQSLDRPATTASGVVSPAPSTLADRKLG